MSLNSDFHKHVLHFSTQCQYLGLASYCAKHVQRLPTSRTFWCLYRMFVQHATTTENHPGLAQIFLWERNLATAIKLFLLGSLVALPLLIQTTNTYLEHITISVVSSKVGKLLY